MGDAALSPQPLHAWTTGDTLWLEGDLAAEAMQQLGAAPFTQWLAAADPGRRLRIELGGLELDSGEALATLITALRSWTATARARGAEGIVLVEAPQDLAHTLYKIGALTGTAMTLLAPRHEAGHLGG